MRHPKLLLGGLLAIVLVIVAILALVPSRATAQGLVEYALLCTEDLGVPPDGYNIIEKEQLENEFGVEAWQDNWGVFVTCTPKFDKRTGVFNKLRICAIAYKDANSSFHLDYGDIKQMEVCITLKQ